MLACVVVESTAKANDITRGSLDVMITTMATEGLIRRAVADQAHEIRHMGNSAAHGDLGDSVTQEEAEVVLNLMAEILNEVWQAPARSRRLAEARAGRRAQR